MRFVADSDYASTQSQNRYAWFYLDKIDSVDGVARMKDIAARVATDGEIDAEGASMLFSALEAANMVTAIGFPGFFDAAEAHIELRLAQRAAIGA